MTQRIHILGASGSGTTTLASVLSKELGYRHFDTDEFFWMKTDPPFQQKNPVEERIIQLKESLNGTNHWILSGSLCGWGDVFIPYFDLVIFLAIPHDIRMDRLYKREKLRYGNKIEKGGSMHETHQIFMDWASQYDTGDMDIRSRRLHEEWLGHLDCPVLKIEEDITIKEKVKRVICFMDLFCADGISVRRMRDSGEDYRIMAKWLSDNRVLEFYEGIDNPFDYDRVVKKWSPIVKELEEEVIPYLICKDGIPVGYLQYYPVTEDSYRFNEIVCFESFINVYGIDLFIGEPELWNSGIGTKVLKGMIKYLFENKNASKICIDPSIHNKRAIRCYEKAGFHIIGTISDYDDVTKEDYFMVAVKGEMKG